MSTSSDAATCPPWLLYTELRKELVSAQERRSRTIGFKITFVATATAAIIAAPEVDGTLLLVPAVASFFFDLLIAGMSISIKRIGRYCREMLEPQLRGSWRWPKHKHLWEEYMAQADCIRSRGSAGNLGLTILVAAIAAIGVFCERGWSWTIPVGVVLLAALVYDLKVHKVPVRSMAGQVPDRVPETE